MKLNMWEKGVIIYVYYGETCRNGMICVGVKSLKGIRKKDRESVFVEHEVNKYNCEFRYSETKGFKMTI